MKARSSTDLLGADISSYQSITDPAQFFTDFKFVYFRAYGSNHADGGDTKFIEFAKLAKQYGVPSGGYFFATPTPGADLKTDAEAQAALFIQKLQAAYGTGKYGDLIPMIDIEEYSGNKYDPATIKDEATMKENMLSLTSLFETSTDYPDNFGVTAGNFDGAGLSHGAIQFNFKSGTLQPIWKDLINQHSDVVRAAITNQADYNYFVDLVLNKTTAEQIAFGDTISDPANKHKIIEPWNTYFKNLGVTQESIDRQILAAQWYYDQAKKWIDTYDLWTRRGYALLFDIAVQAGSIPTSVHDLIMADFAAMDNTGKTPEQIETDKMVIIANRRADIVAIEWRESFRQRKLSIANGSGWVYNNTLFMDTTKYDAILEASYQETIWGYPYAWGMTGTQLKDWLLYFRTYFRATTGNRAVGIYTNRSFLTEAGKMAMTAADLAELDIMPLWLAEWNQTDGYQPPTLGEWYNYAAWQYAVIDDASTHGVSHSANQLDHNITQDLALIMPPKPPTNTTIEQLSNTQIRVTFTPPTDSDYIGSDIYLGGVWKKWCAKGTNTADITVTTPIGGQLQINVVSQDNYQDTSWGANTYHTMVDLTPAPTPVEEPDQIINYNGKVSGDTDTTRKVMVNGQASIELTPTQFGAEWWDYPKLYADDGTLMSYSISAGVGNKIQYMFQFTVNQDEPTPLERLVFRLEGTPGQAFTLRPYNKLTSTWDTAVTVTYNGDAAGYVQIELTDFTKYLGSDDILYLSMLSTASVATEGTAITLSTDYAELLVYRGEAIPPPPPKPEPVAPPPEVLTYDYTEQDVWNMLHAKTGSRFAQFRYDLLDMNDNKLRELTNVESGEVSMNAFNTIKRTARFRLRETAEEPINFLNNRIQPFVMFKLPDKFVQNADGTRVLLEGKWIEYPLGVFLLSSPKKTEVGSQVFRDIEAYDGIVILEEDKFTQRFTVRAGTKYTQAVIDILQEAGITKYNIGTSDRTLPNDVEYEPGTEKTKPISDFLNAINFTPLYVDEYGYFTAQPYVSPSDRDADYTYSENQFSVVANGVEEELDLYSVPNKWVAVYTSVDSTSQTSTSLVSTYSNDNPESQTSTVSRGRTIVDYRKVDEIANQAALDEYVQRIAFEASQIFGKVRFQTAIMPYHGFQDVIFLENDTLSITGKYSETAWRFALKAGAMMEHEVRRVVSV